VRRGLVGDPEEVPEVAVVHADEQRMGDDGGGGGQLGLADGQAGGGEAGVVHGGVGLDDASIGSFHFNIRFC